MTKIVKEDYYGNMYDIEQLTDLNVGGKRPSDPDVMTIENLIRENRCGEAENEIGKYESEHTVDADVRIEILKGALSVKKMIFSDSISADSVNLSPKECALAELSAYLGLLKEEIGKKMLVEKPVAEAWACVNPDPDRPDEVDDFYIGTDAYVYELMAANHIVQTLFSYSVLREKMKQLEIGTILDYGAGAGTLSILFDGLGYDVTFADLPGKLFDFAKWRFEKRGLSIPMFDLKRDTIGKAYDCILCTEVFEHVSDPEGLLRKIEDRLEKNGTVVISESCEYTENFSSHLEKNKKYGGQNFIRLMEAHGFEQILSEPFIPQMIFRKIGTSG